MTEPTSLSELSNSDEAETTDESDHSSLSHTMIDESENIPPLSIHFNNLPTPPPSFSSSSSSPLSSPPHKRSRPNPSPPSSLPLNTRITLNIGGTLFQTTALTLLRLPSYFTSALSHPSFSTSSPLFIDRDAALFPHILNWMRESDLSIICSLSVSELLRLRNEARYYLLTELKESIEMELRRREVKKLEKGQQQLTNYSRTLSNPIIVNGNARHQSTTAHPPQPSMGPLLFDEPF